MIEIREVTNIELIKEVNQMKSIGVYVRENYAYMTIKGICTIH